MDSAERAATGKAARSAAPRTSHGAWEPAEDREDPVAILERQALTRVPGLVPIRYGRMAASPFAFFRGAAAVMAADLARTPVSGLRVQVCGDAHLSNFGAYAAPDRRLVFDLNDFDETLPGPWEWDVKRLAASFAIAGRESGLKRKQRAAVLATVAGTYRDAMRAFASLRNLEVWYARLDVESVLGQVEEDAPKEEVKRVRKNIGKARSKDSLRALEKLTETVDGEVRFRSEPPLLVPGEELVKAESGFDVAALLDKVLGAYRESLVPDRRHLLDGYTFRQIARKVVGVGSVGTRAWVVLLTGSDDQDPLFLQAKEAEASVMERFVGASRFRNHGRRVVEGQRLMQAASDIFLGWCPASGLEGERDFYVRQLWDWKRSAEVERLSPQGLEVYARMCGWTLARAHARSGDRIAIAAYLGAGDAFDGAIAGFAEAYADCNERDHEALLAAIDSGRVEAEDI
jgi:uncharacterized protein (DUF2252 family)